jgi:hypothetical protein
MDKQKETGHPSGLSPTSNGNSKKEVEGSIESFDSFENSLDGPEPHLKSHGEEPLMGPGGDSRPDNGEGAGWTAANDPVVLPEDRTLGAGPKIVKPDPDELARTRVGEDDEIIGRYNPVTGQEDAVLRNK